MQDTIAGRLNDLIVKPGRLMENVAASPKWPLPVLIIALLLAVFTWLTTPITGPEQLELMRGSKMMQFMSEEQWQQQYDEALDPSPVGRALSSLGAGVSTFVMILIFGLILGFFAKMSSGNGTMKQSLGVVAWASLIPFGVATLVKMPLIMITESMFSVSIGLAAFLPDPDPTSAIYQILNTYGDFFTWWGLVVLVIGFQKTHGLSRGTAAASVLLPWALATAIPVGIGLIFM